MSTRKRTICLLSAENPLLFFSFFFVVNNQSVDSQVSVVNYLTSSLKLQKTKKKTKKKLTNKETIFF